MRRAKILAATALLALLSQPALAEPRWLACKYNDTSGKPQTFQMVFDDLRGTASILDNGGLIEVVAERTVPAPPEALWSSPGSTVQPEDPSACRRLAVIAQTNFRSNSVRLESYRL